MFRPGTPRQITDTSGRGHGLRALGAGPRSGGAPGAGNLAAARGPPPPARLRNGRSECARGNGTFRLKTPARDTSNIIYRSKRGYSIAFRAKPTRKLATTRGHWVFGIGKSGPVTRHSKPPSS